MKKLPFSTIRSWRSRWVQHGPRGEMLHRVKRLDNPRAWSRFPSGDGETVCGRKGLVTMPGFMSRMFAKRCPKCCKALGVPNGTGAPYNDPTLFPPEGRACRRSTSARNDDE